LKSFFLANSQQYTRNRIYITYVKVIIPQAEYPGTPNYD